MASFVQHIDWSVKRVPCTLCRVCSERPTSHSIYVRGASDGLPIVYTKPAEADLYNDHAGIVAHFRAVVNAIHPRPWIWVFDCEGLGFRHVIDPRTGIRLAMLLSDDYRSSVTAIVILDANAVLRYCLKIVRMVLSADIDAKIMHFTKN